MKINDQCVDCGASLPPNTHPPTCSPCRERTHQFALDRICTEATFVSWERK